MKHGKFEKFALQRIDLCDLEILQELDESLLDDLLACCQGLRFKKNTEILGHLDNSDSVYFVVSGDVRINMVAAGGRQITYQLLRSGQMFGELSAIDGQPRSASAVAETDASLAVLGGADFVALTHEHPELAHVILRRLASLSRWLMTKLFEYHAFNVRGRIISELVRLALLSDEQPAAVRVADRDMASRVGTTRENVTRIYRDLLTQQIIERSDQGLVVLDVPRLQGILAECEFG